MNEAVKDIILEASAEKAEFRHRIKGLNYIKSFIEELNAEESKYIPKSSELISITELIEIDSLNKYSNRNHFDRNSNNDFEHLCTKYTLHAQDILSQIKICRNCCIDIKSNYPHLLYRDNLIMQRLRNARAAEDFAASNFESIGLIKTYIANLSKQNINTDLKKGFDKLDATLNMLFLGFWDKLLDINTKLNLYADNNIELLDKIFGL